MNKEPIFSLSDIKVEPLRIIRMDDGDVLHNLKCSELSYSKFGESYFSKIRYKSCKGWKMHNRMTMNLTCPLGLVKFVFATSRDDFREIIIGEENYQRITVPPSIWFAFYGLNEPFSLINNIADIEHDPLESARRDLDSLPYCWSKQ